MVRRLGELASELDAELVGDPEVLINGVGSLARASSGQITFLHNRRLLDQLHDTGASAVLLRADDRDLSSLPRLLCDKPYVAFAVLTRVFFARPRFYAGVHPSAVVDDNCRIGERTSIAAGAVIGANVIIGDDCVVGSNCTLHNNCVLGDRCRLVANVVISHDVQLGDDVLIHPGAMIGNDGFGFADDNGIWIKIFHQGRVIIGNDVEIGASTAIDRGTLDDTVIEDGVKIDNLVQISHNVRIGAHTIIAGCAAVAGSTKIGRNCRIGGASGISNHLTICDNVTIGAMSAVHKSIRKPGIYAGIFPIQPYREWRKNSVSLQRLDTVVRRLRRLEKSLAKNNNPVCDG